MSLKGKGGEGLEKKGMRKWKKYKDEYFILMYLKKICLVNFIYSKKP